MISGSAIVQEDAPLLIIYIPYYQPYIIPVLGDVAE